jgi:tetratricopeptide (TPR) repeat protein
MQNKTDALGQIRQYLTIKPAGELVDLLMELIQQMDKTTRRRFWEQLAPSGLATADLRYPSPEAFLAEVETFVNAAAAGEYHDDKAAEYFGEDPADRNIHVERGYIQEYDIEYHAGLSTLETLLVEANSYHEAGRFDIAADAYEQLLGLLLPDQGYELFGVDSPLLELGFNDDRLVEQFFAALCRASTRRPEQFAARAVAFLEPRAGGWQDLSRHLVQICQAKGAQEAAAALRRHLEAQVEEPGQPAVPEARWPETPFLLELLIRLIRALDGPGAAVELCARFRSRYPDLYMPLLEGCTARQAWTELLRFGAQALDLPPHPPGYRYVGSGRLLSLNPNAVRERMAWAQEQLGNLPAAFAHRRAAFEQSAEFEDYQAALKLARRISEPEARRYTVEVIARLRPEAGRRVVLCEVYLYDGDYESAFDVVQSLSGYSALNELKLVAKAHVLAALHGQRVEGEYLPKVKTDLDSSTVSEYACFLRDHLPMPDWTPAERLDSIQRAEHLYASILETHVAAGSKRYKTAAYYCALLAEIAVATGRVEAFEAWYQDLLIRHKRKRSLRGILDAKTQPALRAGRKRQA